MARCSWHIYGQENNGSTRSLMAPKACGSLVAWFKQCRLANPKIPDPFYGKWVISHCLATIEYIVFELRNPTTGEVGHVMVDRTSNSIGF